MYKTLTVLTILLCSCDLYLAGDDEQQCTEVAQTELRDPTTGRCMSVGSDPVCASKPLPDWGACGSTCDALDEQACLLTSGCRAAYIDQGAPGNRFWACWAIAPSGPAAGSCDTLDAQECSRHDDCVSIFPGYNLPIDGAHFEQCTAEPTP